MSALKLQVMGHTKQTVFISFTGFKIIFLLYAVALSSVAQAEVVSLRADNFEHIKFRKIKANIHVLKNQQLKIEVDNSASFLMLPFESVRQVHKVSFQWRSEGVPLIKNSQHELKRSGDDAVFKLGLLLKADNDPINPFVPAWLKQVRKLLKLPSEKMTYLVADARHKPGEKWTNPYNRRVTMIAVKSTADDEGDNRGWQQSSYQFELPLDIVAIWLMADGDNTHSSFTTHIKNINVE